MFEHRAGSDVSPGSNYPLEMEHGLQLATYRERARDQYDSTLKKTPSNAIQSIWGRDVTGYALTDPRCEHTCQPNILKDKLRHSFNNANLMT